MYTVKLNIGFYILLLGVQNALSSTVKTCVCVGLAADTHDLDTQPAHTQKLRKTGWAGAACGRVGQPALHSCRSTAHASSLTHPTQGQRGYFWARAHRRKRGAGGGGSGGQAVSRLFGVSRGSTWCKSERVAHSARRIGFSSPRRHISSNLFALLSLLCWWHTAVPCSSVN